MVPSALEAHKEHVVTLDYKVGLECMDTMRPTRSKEDRQLHMLEIIGAPTKERPIQYVVGNIGFLPGQTEIKWGDGDFPLEMLRCTFTNYSGVPLLKVSAQLTLSWQDVIRKDNGFTSGKVIASDDVSTPYFDLGATYNNDDSFLITNLSPDTFVSVSLPVTASASVAGSQERQLVKLIPSFMPQLGMFPFNRPTNLPVSTPPSQAQPTSPPGR